MTPSQAEQKERAAKEATHHLHHSAVDRMREARMVEGERMDASVNHGDKMRAMKARDANNAYAGEE